MKLQGVRNALSQSEEDSVIYKINCGERRLIEREEYEIAMDIIAIILENKLSCSQAEGIMNLVKFELASVPLIDSSEE